VVGGCSSAQAAKGQVEKNAIIERAVCLDKHPTGKRAKEDLPGCALTHLSDTEGALARRGSAAAQEWAGWGQGRWL
jgi:hypothetical protein